MSDPIRDPIRDSDYAALSDEFARVEREATDAAERLWFSLEAEDRERVRTLGAVACVPDASPAVWRELDHLAASKPLTEVMAEAAREIAEDRASMRAAARRHGEALGSWGIRMYGEWSREERAEADRVWAAMSDEDRERVWKHGAAIVVSGADGSMCRNLGRLADEWAKASGIAEAHTETDPARAARRIAELERALASANDTIDLTASEMGRMRDALHAANSEAYALTQRLAVEARQRDEAIASYDALVEAVEKHLPDSTIPGVTAVDRVIAGSAVLEHHRRVIASVRPVLDDMARSFSASTNGEPHDVAIRVAYRVAELQREHAKAERSAARWRARAKRAAVQRPTRGQRLHAEFLKPPAGVKPGRTTTRGKRTRSKR